MGKKPMFYRDIAWRVWLYDFPVLRRMNDAMMQWCNDAMMQWCNDAMMQWCDDAMMQWCNDANKPTEKHLRPHPEDIYKTSQQTKTNKQASKQAC